MNNRVRDILLMRKTGKVVPVASRFDKSLGLYLNDRDYGGVITTTTGNPVSIITNKAQNAISTILSYSPKQSGSGDPSPQNIRPIEGWTEANLFGCGKNLLDCTQPLVPNPTGSERDGLPFYPPVIGSYTIKPSKRGTDNKRYAYLRGFVVHSDGTYEGYLSFSTTASDADYVARTFEVTRKGDWIFLFAASSVSSVQNIVFSEPQAELGSQSTAYEPYTQGANITANLGGTYYGFSVDVERGVLRVLYGAKDMGSLSWRKTTGEGHFYCTNNLRNFPYKMVSTQNMLCSCYKNDGIGTTNRGYYGADGTFRYFYTSIESSTARELYVTDNTRWATMTVEEFTQAVTGQYVAFELATPIEIDLTPQTVALLAGNNTLWTDGDSLSVTYKAPKS